MGTRFRIASFNVHHCEGRDGRVDVARTARVIQALEAELIVLQELDVGLERSRSADQPAELAHHLGLDVRFFPAMQLGSGSYGLGVAGSGVDGFSAESLPRVADEEPRIVVWGDWDGLRIVTTHLSRNERARVLQTERLAELAREERGPQVILGDLNQPAGDLGPLRAAGMDPVRPRRPIMSRLRPIYQIDHILISRHLAALEARTVRTGVSDHDPIVATLAVAEGSRVESDALR